MDPEQILQFWFADSTADADKAKERYAFWFKATPEIDIAIQTQFADLVSQAQAGGLESWQAAPRSLHARSSLTYTVPPGEYILRVSWLNHSDFNVDTIWEVRSGNQIVEFGDQC